MRRLKDAVSRVASKLSNYRIALNDFIEDDEGLALMNLSILKQNPSLYMFVSTNRMM